MLSIDRTLSTSPHYTDEHFRSPQTVYGHADASLFYIHSDRLWKSNYLKAKKATVIANASGAKPNTIRWHASFLSAYFGYTVIIKHLLSGWNWNNGYPYIIFGCIILSEICSNSGA